mmetsp:Transcript_9808/g.28185  ORF Transcript_9808/g.28185 Transcript_9808/m.28185 type:complete len:94 (-) Transcript_9808:1041-1322(-)
MAKEINVGMFGAGTVGGGVVEIIRRKQDFYAKLGFKFVVKKICVRDASKKRDFELPQGCAVVTDPKEILDDDSLEVLTLFLIVPFFYFVPGHC